MARDAPPKPRLCHLRKWSDFPGYGFNLHVEKGRAGHFVGRVDEDSPAVAGGLRQGDRIVEVNGTNVGNENHQQVIARILSVPEETTMLVVDPGGDELYRKNRVVIRGDMPEVDRMETPIVNPFTKPPPAAENYKGKLCDLKTWPNFFGYGFNLHAEKGTPNHIIGKVEPNSPAEASGMKEGDRVVEVNGVSVLDQLHQNVVTKIKSYPEKVSLLLVGQECETFLRQQKSLAPSELLEIEHFVCPDSSPFINSDFCSATEPLSSTAGEEADEINGSANLALPETKESSSAVDSCNSYSSAEIESRYRLCHMRRSEFETKRFGFTMHASKGFAGHFITEVDPNSTAEISGVRVGDRVIEVNGANVEAVSHKRVVEMIKAIPNETFLLVVNNAKDREFWTKTNRDCCQAETDKLGANKVDSVQNQNREYDTEDSISSDYRLITDEMIEVAEREARTDEQNEAAQKTDKIITSPEKYNSCESTSSNTDEQKPETGKNSPIVISGIEFAPSAKEARRRMKKKSRVKEENLSIRDKHQLFEKL